MARYIDADALLLKIDLHGTNKFGMLDEDIREFVKQIPTDDVEEVVRCSECVMHEKGCPLDTHPYMTPDDGYCYKGKRRTDDGKVC